MIIIPGTTDAPPRTADAPKETEFPVKDTWSVLPASRTPFGESSFRVTAFRKFYLIEIGSDTFPIKI